MICRLITYCNWRGFYQTTSGSDKIVKKLFAGCLGQAREEILKSWRETCALNKDHPLAKVLFDPTRLPGFHDPFAGGAAIPLEAQRLGLEAFASDLNPVAVMINKALIEIPSRFSETNPVGPIPIDEETQNLFSEQGGAQGLSEDVRRYGACLEAEAQKRIGHLYPDVEVTNLMAKGRDDLTPFVGKKLKVIGWIWARTVKSPNPAFSHVDVPLVSTFVLSCKKGKEVFVEPVVSGDSYHFRIANGEPPKEVEEGTVSRSGARCLVSGVPMPFKYLREQAKKCGLGVRLMAVVAETARGKIYLPPIEEHEGAAKIAKPQFRPETVICHWPGRTNVVEYGMTKFGDLFTDRQLVALNTLADLVQEIIEKCRNDALKSGFSSDPTSLDAGGNGALAYAQAVGTYLGMSVSRWADLSNTICTWNTTNQNVRALFSRQSIPMTWDFVEVSPFGKIAPWYSSVESIVDLFSGLPINPSGKAIQKDARDQKLSQSRVVSTDPPYYDNICYSDLSDFFYVWLRRSLLPVFPSLLEPDAVPKKEELVANPYRCGGKEAAEQFFLEGMKSSIRYLAEQAHPAFPITIYYAFKQSKTDGEEGASNTGWHTFLQAVLGAGFAISGTWPMSTERDSRSIGIESNALASSIILVCRPRNDSAPAISRREFVRELNSTLPEALEDMTTGGDHPPVAPVDLSQAIIGPGMAIFSKYSAVLEADGKPMSVRTALQLINRFLSQDDFDHDTQFCVAWFDGHGWDQGKFGEADVLARAKGTRACFQSLSHKNTQAIATIPAKLRASLS